MLNLKKMTIAAMLGTSVLLTGCGGGGGAPSISEFDRVAGKDGVVDYQEAKQFALEKYGYELSEMMFTLYAGIDGVLSREEVEQFVTDEDTRLAPDTLSGWSAWAETGTSGGETSISHSIDGDFDVTTTTVAELTVVSERTRGIIINGDKDSTPPTGDLSESKTSVTASSSSEERTQRAGTLDTLSSFTAWSPVPGTTSGGDVTISYGDWSNWVGTAGVESANVVQTRTRSVTEETSAEYTQESRTRTIIVNGVVDSTPPSGALEEFRDNTLINTATSVPMADEEDTQSVANPSYFRNVSNLGTPDMSMSAKLDQAVIGGYEIGGDVYLNSTFIATTSTISDSGLDTGLNSSDIVPVWITDTGATTAWADGWTGKGQTIAVVDYFTSRDMNLKTDLLSHDVTVYVPDLGQNIVVSASILAESALNGHVNTTSHGNIVSSIAGGESTFARGGSGYASVTTTQDITLGDGSTIPAGTTLSVEVTLAAKGYIYGVAAGAEVVKYNVEDLTGFDADVTSAVQSGADVINISIGQVDSYDPTSASDAYYVNNREGNLSSHQVAVVSAGNHEVDADGDVYVNTIAVSFDNAQTIVAGSFNKDGDTYATDKSHYVNAGFTDINFLVARDDLEGVAQYADGSAASGTSFSAPRISGAAAIVGHKFPTLSGSGVVNTLMDNADTDTFDGESVDVLNLNAALAP